MRGFAWLRVRHPVLVGLSLIVGCAGSRRVEPSDAGVEDDAGRLDAGPRDSDGDSILDVDEGRVDVDGDGVPNHLDLDSDGDGVDDAAEAGDGDLRTAPSACDAEGSPDGCADFVDADSDGDGLADGEEVASGTDRCAPDSDSDGIGDLVEAYYARTACPAGGSGPGCGCPTDAACQPDAGFAYVVAMPHAPTSIEVELDSTNRAIDVVFLFDSSAGTIETESLASALAAGRVDLSDRLVGVDLALGAAMYSDFPFGSYGIRSCDDVPLELVSELVPSREWATFRERLAAMDTLCGADAPESHTEALYRLITGAGETWRVGSSMLTLDAATCDDGRYGAPCFRPGALPLVLHTTDICSHMEPPGGSSLCMPYVGVEPAPTSWAVAIDALERVGARYVGLWSESSYYAPCDGTESAASPCFFYQQTALATGTVGRDGLPLEAELPNAMNRYEDTLVRLIERVLTDVAQQLTLEARDDPSDPAGADARDLVASRSPACTYDPLVGPLPSPACWTPPDGVALDAAVSLVDSASFYDALPGTRARFEVVIDSVPGAHTRSTAYGLYLDLVAEGVRTLDTKHLLVIVPTAAASCGG